MHFVDKFVLKQGRVCRYAVYLLKKMLNNCALDLAKKHTTTPSQQLLKPYVMILKTLFLHKICLM